MAAATSWRLRPAVTGQREVEVLLNVDGPPDTWDAVNHAHEEKVQMAVDLDSRKVAEYRLARVKFLLQVGQRMNTIQFFEKGPLS